jgi:FixJ family two-component response regulator
MNAEVLELPNAAYRCHVHVVDDDDDFRSALEQLLRISGYAVTAHPCANHYLQSAAEDEPSCVLLDLRMPGPSGLDLLSVIASSDWPPPVIFVTGHEDFGTAVRAMKGGAADYLLKPVCPAKLQRVIRKALLLDMDRYTMRRHMRVLRECYSSLTALERDVLVGVTSGRLNKQIGSDLHVSERTVKSLRSSAMEKMGAESIITLVRFARQLGVGDRRA